MSTSGKNKGNQGNRIADPTKYSKAIKTRNKPAHGRVHRKAERKVLFTGKPACPWARSNNPRCAVAFGLLNNGYDVKKIAQKEILSNK